MGWYCRHGHMGLTWRSRFSPGATRAWRQHTHHTTRLLLQDLNPRAGAQPHRAIGKRICAAISVGISSVTLLCVSSGFVAPIHVLRHVLLARHEDHMLYAVPICPAVRLWATAGTRGQHRCASQQRRAGQQWGGSQRQAPAQGTPETGRAMKAQRNDVQSRQPKQPPSCAPAPRQRCWNWSQ